MKKQFTEEQIIGFLREAEAGLPMVVADCSICYSDCMKPQ